MARWFKSLGGIFMENQTVSSKLPKLSFLKMFGYGTGDFAQNLIYNTVSTYLLFFYTNVYGLNPASAATMFLVVRVIDAINDPVMGTIIDKHTNRFGKYRGWLLYMAIPFAVMAILCFYTPNLGQMGKLIYAYITYVGLSIIYTTVNIPYGSLNAAMTRDNDEIVKMSSVRMFLANIGGMCVSYGIPIFVKLFSGGSYSGTGARMGWFITLSMYGIVGALILIFCFSQTKERIKMPTNTQNDVHVKDLFHQLVINKPLRVLAIFFIITFGLMSVVNSVGAYYVSYNMQSPDLLPLYNLLPGLPAFILIPLTPWMNRIFGKKRLVMGSLIVAAVCLTAMYFTPATNIVAVFALRIVAQMGITEATTFMWALVPETITYGEWKTGKRENGIVNAIIGFFFKFGMALGGVVPGYVLAAFTFNANNTAQSAHSMQGILLVQTLIPVAFLIIAMIDFAFYNLKDEDVNKMNAELEASGSTEQSADGI